MAMLREKHAETASSSSRNKNPIAAFLMKDQFREGCLSTLDFSEEAARQAWQKIKPLIPEPETLRTGSGVVQLRSFGMETFDPKHTVTVRTLGFQATLEKDSISYQDFCLARSLRGTMITFATPGTGLSSRPNRLARKNAKQGDFIETERPIGQLLADMGIKHLNIIGYSFGAELATGLAMACPDGITIDNLFVMASPSEIVSTRKELAAREQEQAKLYPADHLHPFTAERAGAYGYGLGVMNKGLTDLKNISRYFKNPDVILDYASGMAAGQAYQQRRAALLLHPEMKLTIGVPGNDSLSPKNVTLSSARKLQADFPGRVRVMLFPGEDHGFEDQAERYADITAQALRA